ncbi:hypothetical protein A8C56_06390 [Niabella ginsenosidivorans]|uniref:Uncharacterized protein n=1 Tax=Niabella ginsenosidivorans TaxID=1176587 RepID=A0A1A9HZ49_9BACT|nr:hypothetical protein [Niabella ginsenosidivorans]ANH80656.1 hypothetical protein A8C56_06390 [Niabella ginsenosidivorans]
MKNKKPLKLKHWLKKYPADCMNRHLRTLLAHYIGSHPDNRIDNLGELVLDITALMELLDVIDHTAIPLK